MSSIAKNELFLNSYYTFEEICHQVDAVTPSDIQRMARALFHDPGRSILALGPKPSRKMAAQLGL
jgi:predicted Zn-dependent peptidase